MGKITEDEFIQEILKRGPRAVFAPNFSKLLDELVTEEKIPDPIERARVRGRIALAMIKKRKELRMRAS